MRKRPGYNKTIYESFFNAQTNAQKKPSHIAIVREIFKNKKNMTVYHQLLLPYRQNLKPTDSNDVIAWTFLQALNDIDRELGIYYIFEPGKVNDKTCLSIVNKLDRLKLANKLKTELGNKNYYMSIKPEGTYALENFNSIDEYEKYMNDKNKPKSNNSINIVGDVTSSQFVQESDFSRLEIKNIKSKNPIKEIPTETPKKKSDQWIGFFSDKKIKVMAFITSIIALVTKILELW